ncbi:MAG: Sec-independent protein translocase protein TatB [Agarilytica sp.]
MGIAELFVIAIVGLLVIGPDKLPETIKTTLVWFGRLKRMLNDTRTELEQQLGVDDIRREIHNQQVLDSLQAIKDAQQAAEKSALEAGNEVTKNISDIGDDVKKTYSPDFEADDEGLFGEQHANHPPEPIDDGDGESASNDNNPDKPSR